MCEFEQITTIRNGEFERIVKLLQDRHLKQKDLTDYLGIPKNQFTNWKAGRTKSYNKYLCEIADFFDVSTDYLLNGEDTPLSQPNNNKTQEAFDMYNKLDDNDKAEIRGEMRQMLRANKYKSVVSPLCVNITYFDIPASAGTGSQLDYEYMRTIQIAGDEIPNHADYVLRIMGNSMEPKFHDGDFVFIQKSNSIEYGDIGIFYYDGCSYIKKYDPKGLVSLNPKYKVIPANEEIQCLGKVIRKVFGDVIL